MGRKINVVKICVICGGYFYDNETFDCSCADALLQYHKFVRPKLNSERKNRIKSVHLRNGQLAQKYL